MKATRIPQESQEYLNGARYFKGKQTEKVKSLPIPGVWLTESSETSPGTKVCPHFEPEVSPMEDSTDVRAT